MRVKRQAHKRKTKAADEDTLTRGTAAIFVTAAVRILQREHGWDAAAAEAFGGRMIVTAQDVAREFLQAVTQTATQPATEPEAASAAE